MEIDDKKHKICYLLKEAKILFELKGAIGNLILFQAKSLKDSRKCIFLQKMRIQIRRQL